MNIDFNHLFHQSIERTNKNEIILFFAPMEPLTANPILRELMGDFGAKIVSRPKILPQHLLKAKKWQFWEKILQKSKKSIYDGVQIIARPEDPLKPALKFLSDNSHALGIDYVDLNFCCPGYKILPQNRGGELLKNPHIILKVIEKSLKYTDLPISIKIRRGFSLRDTPIPLLSQIFREFGQNIAWITINRAPVKMQGVDLHSIIKSTEPFQQAIDAVENKIPIIANGGFNSPEQIQETFSQINISGVMIGRSALGNPNIFQSTLNFSFQAKDQKRNLKSNNLNEGLEKFMKIAQYYATHKQGRWASIGELKRQIYPFIKYKYTHLEKSLPPGYGFNKWHRSHFTPTEFVKTLNIIFPKISIDLWSNWLKKLKIL
ncbi:MAG: tRNA-dihydrouridine synthase family protein [Candidatus Lokiarchaeota archaeon]|nr:tRNA-dihydrouridine synthase family protein [Candidatus Harpocratesius repetitus]